MYLSSRFASPPPVQVRAKTEKIYKVKKTLKDLIFMRDYSVDRQTPLKTLASNNFVGGL